MLPEPTEIVNEEDLELPEITTGVGQRPAPSFTDEEIWDFAGNRGVFSDTPQYFKYCFDTLVHREGTLIYRMKPKKEWFITIKPRTDSKSTGLFSGVMFHDAMEHFITRECGDLKNPNDLCIMHTHDRDGDEFDYMENWCTIPYERFKKYLDPVVSFHDFDKEVRLYLDEESKKQDEAWKSFQEQQQKKQKLNDEKYE
jgi:hypothetical protein